MGLEVAGQIRFEAIQKATDRKPRKFKVPVDESGRHLDISDFFGERTFGVAQMREKLPKDVFNKLTSTIELGKKIDASIADTVANAIKEWALGHGATHFCHWFQPMTGLTAEKHDSFLSLDENRVPVERFSGSQLIQSEPDASSFPSGGMRTTFEARGYTAWDPSSPVFIMESTNGKTLCIPSVFVSYHGDSLDKKTVLLRSMEVLSDRACRLLELIGEKGVKRVASTLGLEQEYFLVDRALVSLRPDLLMAGRTLTGCAPAKGQQLDDHYFGSIPSRAQAFMSEMEFELYRLGVPVKTRHNEVAPSQFEMAPIFEEANVATDHNQLAVDVIKRVARKHNFKALLHEKPFAEVNGSGKHSNWSLMVTASGSDRNGENLLEPGKTPHQNMRFLLFLVATLRGVHKHGGLLRGSIASSGNDHRLGANEAPPAIISVFLGSMLTEILDAIEGGSVSEHDVESAVIKLGVSNLPLVSKDNTDRNRTSPFAFTGNKFELRAVGSSASSAFPCSILNGAVAEGLEEITGALDKKLQAGETLDKAVFAVLREFIQKTKDIRFEGNNYGEEWIKEAKTRGLPNLRKTPEALAQLMTEESKEMFTRLGLMNEAELTSRYNVRLERYIKDLAIEVGALREMIDTQILPACFAYHRELSVGLSAAKAAGLSGPQAEVANKIASLLSTLQRNRMELDSIMNKVEGASSEEEQAKILVDDMLQAMEESRQSCDQLEGLVADAYWPLPKYRELLFIS